MATVSYTLFVITVAFGLLFGALLQGGVLVGMLLLAECPHGTRFLFLRIAERSTCYFENLKSLSSEL